MKDIFRKNKEFIIPYLVFLAVAGIVLVVSNKSGIHLFINRYHSDVTDFFFKYITYLGDGRTVIVVSVLLLFKSLRYGFFTGLSYIGSGIIVQICKRVIFSDVVRPVVFFEHVTDLHLVRGVELYRQYTFPSAHTAAAFALFFGLALLVRSRMLKLACLLGALLVACSRIYLSQHFLIDVYFGSMIGMLPVPLLYIHIVQNPGAWLDRPLVTALAAIFRTSD